VRRLGDRYDAETLAAGIRSGRCIYVRQVARSMAAVACVALALLLAATSAAAGEIRDNGEVRQEVMQINVNTASAEQMQMLYRVGPVLAGRIVAEREAGGPFGSLADLEARVKGVGPRWVACNADHVAFSGSTDLEVKIRCEQGDEEQDAPQD
jgi:hypothetical protein